MEELVPIKIVKVTSNDNTPLIYLPVEVRRVLGLGKGDRVLLYIDSATRRLVIEKIAGYPKAERKV